MKTELTLNKWSLFFKWVLGNIVGILVLTPIATMLSVPLFNMLITVFLRIIRKLATLTNITSIKIDNGMLPAIFIIIPLVIIIPSILTGVFQWLVLRSYISNAKQWILVSFIGLGIGLFITVVGGYFLTYRWNLPEIITGLMNGGIGAIIGITLGTAQWFFLRKHVRYSSIWILGNIISCSLGTSLAWGWSFLGTPGDQGIWFIFAFIYLLIRFVLLYSIVSGIMLTWMLSHPAKELQMATAT